MRLKYIIILLFAHFCIVSCTEVQEPNYDMFTLSPTVYEFKKEGESMTFHLASGSEWHISKIPSWLSVTEITPADKPYEWDIELSCNENTGTTRYQEIVEFTAGDNKPLTITVSQPGGDCLYYGDGKYVSCWGRTKGGVDEWAVRFPATKLAPYSGMYVTKFRVYYNKAGSYPFKVYQGGDTSPTTTIVSNKNQIDNTGWVTITNFDHFLLNTKESLWVSVGFTYEAGEYPKCASAGINEPDARWCYNGTKWYDIYDNNGNCDLCWMIQVFLSYPGTKSGGEVVLGWHESSDAHYKELSNDETRIVNSSDEEKSLMHNCQMDCK